MRARRLCERKNSGRCQVPDGIHADYFAGGEKREVLEMALLEAIAKYGVDRKAYKKVKVFWILISGFITETPKFTAIVYIDKRMDMVFSYVKIETVYSLSSHL